MKVITPWSYINRAAYHLNRGRRDKALTLLQQAVAELPTQAAPKIQLGLYYLENGSPQKALDLFHAACRDNPNNPAGFLFAGLACLDLDLLQDAKSAFDTVATLCPGNQVLPTARAILALKNVNLTQAFELLNMKGPAESPHELAHSTPIISRLLIEIEKLLLPLEVPFPTKSSPLPDDTTPPKNISIKRPSLTEELINLPHSLKAKYLQRRGLKLLEQAASAPQTETMHNHLQQAIDTLKRSYQLDPTLLRNSFYLAEALLFSLTPKAGLVKSPELIDDIKQLFLESWVRDGEHPYIFYYLGRLSLIQGQLETAASYYKSAIKRFAKFPEAHYGLGQCKLLLGDTTEARRHLAEAAQDDPMVAHYRLSELKELHDNGEGLVYQLPLFWEL